jgi:hypothetical protein
MADFPDSTTLRVLTLIQRWEKQEREELAVALSTDITESGWPADERHPVYRSRSGGGGDN